MKFVENVPEMHERKFADMVFALKQKAYGTSFIFKFFNILVKYRIDKILDQFSEEGKIRKIAEMIGDGGIVTKENYEEKYAQLLMSEDARLIRQYPPTFLQYGFNDSDIEITIASNDNLS